MTFAEFPVPVKIVLSVEDVIAFRASHLYRFLISVGFAHVCVSLVLAREFDQAKTAAEKLLFRNGGFDRVIVDRVCLAVHLHVLVQVGLEFECALTLRTLEFLRLLFLFITGFRPSWWRRR